jgi:cytochrome c biogenesis protein CcmG, thiol:disulfide interchange protein DsbE
MKRRGTRGAVIAGTICLLAAGSVAAQDEEIGLPAGTVPPAVQIEDLDGKPVDLAQYVGKGPLLVEFWATWCPLCKALMPRMEAAHHKYGDRVQFLVVAVAVNQSPASIKRHQAEHALPFPILWDTQGRATRAFDAPSTSYVVVLDAKGRVVYTGSGSDQDIDGAVRKAVGRS